mmetsp:Transcript_3369/g.4930  ORF Transcript_3369/g.4930 Transcript_3369/m.4930 type:complete len:418 (+) Transcript_3369:237-1490(+)|eukprot:CAMPEP_0118688370 /NCGR_PEP_ID=MMETSP0800-20121206/8881_1 /TAXON_ID=210618 ORGANISM="Striatella unipunctata, Strain CCMP2910" /NCGR_SAMPLE_ID=MMETSP0800 /ASSEMBLY_ACC=CAM_ASM_000638 /LENGTH=417 /DNA_ID=CAMNT_0006585619 /DNA_START=138 /DNA_END=1391 /DNA_ORIENTATION=+
MQLTRRQAFLATAFLASSCTNTPVDAFAPSSTTTTPSFLLKSAATADESTASAASSSSSDDATTTDPLLIRAARGEDVERTPVWMMRQAGRHMQVYRDLCKKHTTFRHRSEIAEVAVEISLQPWEAYQTDGCILFSDILTPLPGMGAEFEIDDKLGPVMKHPIETYDDLKTLHDIDPDTSTPFVKEALQELRKKVAGTDTAVLGFVGSPFTLATYLVEGKTSRDYLKTKRCMYTEPELFKQILQHLANNIAQYAKFQIESGAQLIQLFDSWAGHLSPRDYEEFAAPYQTYILDEIKKEYPNVPTVMYIKHSGALIERMAGTGVDVVSLDWTVDMAEGRDRIQAGRSAAGLEGTGGVQGNLDPGILFAPDEVIAERAHEILRKAGPKGHVMNLGHGIEAATSQEKAHFFIDTVRNFRH